MSSNLRVDTILPSSGTTLGIGTAGGTINFLGNSNLTTSGDVTIGGNLGVGGTITYEDVARVDATGLSTFREGFHLGPLAGVGLTAYKDGSIRSTGIITATELVSSKINPPNLSAGNYGININQWGGVGIRTTKFPSYGMAVAGPSGAAGASFHDSGGLFLTPTDPFFATGRTYPGIMWCGNTDALNRARAGITAVATNSNDASDICFYTRSAANGTSLTSDDEKFRITSDGKIKNKCWLGIGTATTAERDAGVGTDTGTAIYNASNNKLQYYNGTAWKQLNTAPETLQVDFLVIAGGGAGGGSWRGGGGGAGGYRSSNSNYGGSGGGASAEDTLVLNADTAYSVIIGAGGVGVEAGQGGSGGNSTFGTITSTGGGGGGQYQSAGAAGGSGGGRAGSGGATNEAGGAGTANQGHAGGASPSSTSVQCGGGGGGAGGVGIQGGNSGTSGDGGPGKASTITGSSVIRAGGGGAGAYDSGNNFPIAGTGGAGPGRWTNTSSGVQYENGHDFTVQNSGSGGGGSATPDGDNDDTGGRGGTGAKGVVIIRIPNTYSATFTGGVTSTVASVGSDKVYTITNTSDSSQTVTFS